jgi:GNAT superfamily N-acetyltransferase
MGDFMANILRVDLTNRKQLKQFIHFPFHLYQNCPQWVPPLVKDAYYDFNPEKGLFFQHSQAQLFLAEDNGKTTGRLAVMDNRRFNDFRGDTMAFFGFFDVVEDLPTSQALFQAAFKWARSQGLTRMIGPRGLMSSDNSGVLVEGFQHRAAMGLPYNYPYYDSFIKEAGFEKDTDILSGYARGDEQLPERLSRIAERIQQRRGFEVIHFRSMKDRKTWIPRVWEVLLEAFEDSHNYCPPTQAEMDSIANSIISIADPRLIKLIQKDGRLIGFIFAYHDITAGIQKARGRIWPIGWLYLLLERKRTKWVNINGAGVLPAYQGMGVNAILYTEIKKSIEEFGFEHIDVVQVDEANFQSRSDMETMGIRWYKSHRSYKRDL